MFQGTHLDVEVLMYATNTTEERINGTKYENSFWFLPSRLFRIQYLKRSI